jgi:hypothetical protein
MALKHFEDRVRRLRNRLKLVDEILHTGVVNKFKLFPQRAEVVVPQLVGLLPGLEDAVV